MHTIINETSLTFVAIVMGTLQFSVTAGFIWTLRRQIKQTLNQSFHPNAAVVIPCKGSFEAFEDNIRSMLSQEYNGFVEFIFVSPSKSDPAYKNLVQILSTVPDVETRLLCSDAVPERCSEKILNLLHGIKNVSPETKILAFADCDVRVDRHWLTYLAAPLENPKTVASLTQPVFIPYQKNWAQMLKMAAFCLPASATYLGQVVSGCAWAVRLKDFRELDIESAWSSSLTDDLVLGNIFREDGRRMVLASNATISIFEDCDFYHLQRFFNKSFLYMRFYEPAGWVLTSLAILGVTCLLYWACIPPVHWRLLALVFGINALNIYVIFAALNHYLPHQFRGINPRFELFSTIAALSFPAVLAVYLLALLNSIFTREVIWGDYIYRIQGPKNIEVRKANSSSMSKPAA